MEPHSQGVSVVVVNYKRTKEAKRALLSALNQNYPYIEVVLVLDYPNPELSDWVKSMRSDDILIVEKSIGSGLAVARNIGAHASSGAFIAFLDDDDEWEPEKISAQVECMSKDRLTGIVSCGVSRRMFGREVVEGTASVRGRIDHFIKDSDTLLRTVPSSILIKRSTFDAVGGFDEDLKTGIDHDFWFKLAEHRVIADYVELPLVIEHLSYESGNKMTTRIPERLDGLETFCGKWQPRFAKLFGSTFAAGYFKQYLFTVLRETLLRTYENLPQEHYQLLLKRTLNAERCWRQKRILRIFDFRLRILSFLGPKAYGYLKRTLKR
jgi:glycosyltransferase involved in cell wall biosynthesis